RRAGVDAGRVDPSGRAEPARPPAARGEPRDALHHPRPRHRPPLLRRDPGDVPRRGGRARLGRRGDTEPAGGLHQAAAGGRPRTVPAHRPLHEGLTLTVTDGPAPFEIREVPATVPGTLILDLHAAGLIEDPYLDRNEHAPAWTGECDVTYATRFAWSPTGAAR